VTSVRDFFDYAAGIDEREGMRSIANEMYAMPFLTPAYCRALIEAAEATGGFEPDPGDPVPGVEVSIARLSPMVFEAMENDIGARIWPHLQTQWDYIDYHGINDAFIIKYELGGQESLRIHHDVAQVSMSVKLNDDYEGAELSFPRQRASNADLAVGELVAWPSLVTHPHESLPIRSGIKYSLTIWCELPLAMR
jgi:2OG-Fe(II) oxygenase superfamily